MTRIFAFVALACLSALSSAASAIERVVSFSLGLIPDMVATAPNILLDNGHPRSPLASLRAGVA